VAQAVECLPNKHKALNLKLQYHKKINKYTCIENSVGVNTAEDKTLVLVKGLLATI
jgi:hypothetical protein